MSKLTIVLYTVLFASASNASFWSILSTPVNINVEEVINNAISEVTKQSKAAQENAQGLVDRLFDDANKLRDGIISDVTNTLQKVDDEMKSVFDNIEGVDISECKALSIHLNYTARSFVDSMSACFNEKVETGAGYVNSIIAITQNVVANMTKINEEYQECGNNVIDFISGINAAGCYSSVTAKAVSIPFTVIPEMLVEISNLGTLLAALPPSLIVCSNTAGRATFYEEASTIIDRTAACIQEKIGLAPRKVNPKFQYAK